MSVKFANSEKVADPILEQGTVPFQTEGRLLQELGERLVASPEVALVELIKNAYDADSPSCEVQLSDGDESLRIIDYGHGMTFDDFVGKWMHIATASKVAERVSRTYKRQLTGAKGIGRFAVRYLGEHLTLITVADDPKRRQKTRLSASFDWTEIDQLSDIREAEIKYKLEQAAASESNGTILEIRKLKTSTDFAANSSLRSDVLRIVTPLQGLESGRFKLANSGSKIDPGFRVLLPGESPGVKGEVDLAGLVLQNYWARLLIELKGRDLTFNVWFASSSAPKTFNLKVANVISAGFVADIRFFPRRKGVFRAKGVNGQAAWKWVRGNHGVAVVDHGFRVVPYGYRFDDWLHLDSDSAHNERDWRSEIAKEHFAIPAAIRQRPADNPALYLPTNFQLVGAVFVESKPPNASKSGADLTPSMDREGFLRNEGFDQLVEFVRAGIEFLAQQDKRELDRIEAKEARQATQNAKEEVRQAIGYIKRSPTLIERDKVRIIKTYRQLADRLEEVEEYNARARRSLITMSLLGVVAGFMTHETKSLVFEMEKAVKTVASLAKKHPVLSDTSAELERRLSAFRDQLQYSQMFLQGVQRDEAVSMSAAGQIRHVLNRFGGFALDHGVKVTSECSPDVHTPSLPPAIYSGVLLNLYTNALKAVLAVTASIREPKVTIRAWNEGGTHCLEVADNGVGIPPELRKRIWDPLYTTTSDTGNPLGSGMGLGLTLIKEVIEQLGGKIYLTDTSPPGFVTCFRVELRME
jgi:signal transduction histidine kinase